MANPILHVRIISPQQVILNTDAYAVSSKNLQGDFDILPQHANFITLIENQPIVIRVSKQKRFSFAFPLAIIWVVENQINIYIPIPYDQPQSTKLPSRL